MSRATTLTYLVPGRASATIAVATVLAAALAGVALASDVPLGIAVLCAAFYLPVVLLNLPLGVALWLPLAFLEGLPAFNLAGKAGGLLLVAGWVGALRSGVADTAVLARHRRLLQVLALFLVWLSLSLVWAPDLLQARSYLWYWFAVVLLFLVVATAVASETALKLVTASFVVGAVVSVLASYLYTGGGAARLEVSTTGNPNLLAAGLVPAIALAAALTAVARGPVSRGLLFVTIGVLAAALVATQSRGGIVAAFAAGVAALVLLKRRRRQVVAVGLMALGVAAISFMLDPTSWQRVTEPPGRGTGRIDLWTVAWGITEEHPVNGIGLNNYGVVAADYVRDVGPLERVDLISDRPHSVHNAYLQFLAETGVVGLLLFSIFAVGCLYAGWRAAAMFRSIGRPELEAIAHGIVIATVGMLAGGIFADNSVDRRLWVLFALGPAALGVANNLAAGRRSPTPQ